MILKRIRKICLRTGCKNKATHFGVGGKMRNGLCDVCYMEYVKSRAEIRKLGDKILK